jgi:hypothetical protein
MEGARNGTFDVSPVQPQQQKLTGEVLKDWAKKTPIIPAPVGEKI